MNQFNPFLCLSQARSWIASTICRGFLCVCSMIWGERWLLIGWIVDLHCLNFRGRRGRDHMVVGFTTTCAISIYHHLSCEFESHSWLCVLDTTLCDKVRQWLSTGWWFSTVTPGFLHHDITEILLKVALNTHTP